MRHSRRIALLSRSRLPHTMSDRWKSTTTQEAEDLEPVVAKHTSKLKQPPPDPPHWTARIRWELVKICSRREGFQVRRRSCLGRATLQVVIKKTSNATQKELDLVAVVAEHTSKHEAVAATFIILDGEISTPQSRLGALSKKQLQTSKASLEYRMHLTNFHAAS